MLLPLEGVTVVVVVLRVVPLLYVPREDVAVLPRLTAEPRVVPMLVLPRDGFW